MIFKGFILLIAFASLTLSLPVKSPDAQLVHSTANSEFFSINNVSSVLERELRSLMVLNKIDVSLVAENDNDDKVLIIPRHHINERTMNGLGFRDYVKHAKKLKLSNREFDSSLEILVPEKTRPFFIFNTTDPLNIPIQKTRVEYSNFIDHSTPFDLPEFSEFTDFCLVINAPKKFDIKLLHDDMLLVPKYMLPLYKQALDEQIPLLALIFNTGSNAFDAKEHNLPLLKVKNYIASDFSLFFDIFAREWIGSVGYSQLVHSIFCTVNVQSSSNSYCIKVKEDMNNLVLFPAYNGLKKDNGVEKRHFISDDSDDEQIKFALYTGGDKVEESLGLEKRGGAGGSLLQKVKNSAKFQELTLPLSIIKDNDDDATKSTDTYSPRAKGYSQVLSKLKQHKNKLQPRDAAKVNHHEWDAAKLDDLSEKLSDRLKVKNERKKVKDNSNTFVISQASRHVQRETDKNGKKIKKVFKTKNSDEPINEDESTITLKQVQDATPKNSDSQEHTDKVPSKAENKESVPECLPITWANVFHQSIFGNQKFCGV
ncbi:putative secreted protein [Wickerhamomyces ciferrii]|uniref:Secreted protein n=1 Tax=Wickerhamomyces ciferrii (strain ATCC 14091 / BCRC 22168 / CBS 111 / JCM 3599 / NBRC 0793 / NRRL Y-1031 F-60-10) TaxID=1206466 RepID=K0KX43_WICCF|nr:uncharacterized protein BN7_6211 [Wickerhamomyces ciferrii]CCH46617.1 putative secreted protein [Wickerhamomyces ciferrii]